MKITKAPKKLAEATPRVKDLLSKIAAADDDHLPDVLDQVLEWCWPRGDLHYWTQTLNRFDTILADTIREYNIDKIQTRPFDPHRKTLVASILRFTRLLIENCTNRKLYNSYDRLNDLLMALDNDILEATLRLLLRPAQQFSSQGGGRSELPISVSRLSTLALTWVSKEHGYDMATMIRANAPVTDDMLGIRFQFYRRSGDSSSSTTRPPESSATGATAEAGPSSRAVDSTPVRAASSSRRPAPHTSMSATSGLALAQSPDTRQISSATATATASSNPSREGLVTVRIKNVLATGKQPAEIFQDIVEEYSVPVEDRYDLFQKIRVAASMPDPAARRQLLLCRLFALACYCHLVSESVANSQLFLYEPDIVSKTAAFVEAMSKEDQIAQATGFYALDGLGRYGSKLSDVLSSVSASVNHGILLRTLRMVIEDLARDSDQVSELLIDSIFGFISFITSAQVTATQSGSSMVVGAGLIPLFVQLVDTCRSKQYMAQRTVCRAIGLIDSLLYTYPPSLQWFVDVRGPDAYVNRVQSEVEADLQDEDAQMSDDSLAPADTDPLYGKLNFGRASLLRNLLRCISHMLQSMGTAEGVRGLIDSSLLDSISQVMKNRKVFGPQILSFVLNIMATFVHNEPTSFAVLQEKKVPELFFDLIEAEIEASSEVISAIPNCIGAICLNEAGLNLFNSRADKVVPMVFSILTSKRHSVVLQDRDNGGIFGSAIDELIRHQPSMKAKVLDSVLHALDEIYRLGEAYQVDVPEEADARARLQLVPELTSGSQTDSGPRDLPVRSLALGDVVLDEVTGHRRAESKSTEVDSDIIGYIDVMARFLDGFFQSSSHCKDFLKSDGLERLLKLITMPCLPYNFPSTMAADALVALLTYVSEMSPGAVVGVLLKEVKRGIIEADAVWQADGNVSSLKSVLAPSSEAALAQANKHYHTLISLNARLYLLATVIPSFGHSGVKTPAAVLQTLQGSGSGRHLEQATITEMGDLLRRTSWENVLLKATAPPLPKRKGEEGDSAPAPQPGFPDNLLEDNPGTVEQHDSAMADSILKDPQADPCLRNSVGLRYLLLQMPYSLTNIFCETTRLLSPKKASDPANRRIAAQMASSVGESLVQQLKWQDSSNLSNSFAFATTMIGHVTNVVLDDRPTSVCANTSVLLPFERAGGVEAILAVFKRYLEDFEANQSASSLDPQEASLRLGHICGGLKVALNPMQNFSAAQVIIDAPATQQLANKDNVGSAEGFKPHELLLRLRLAILPPIRETWQKEWLHKLPLSVNRSVMQTLLHILQGEGEDPPKPRPEALPANSGADGRGSILGPVDALFSGLQGGAVGSSGVGSLIQRGATATTGSQRRPNFTLDESRLQQMVDMGFARRAARQALTRYSNNTNAATEFLLAHPEMGGSSADEPDEPSLPERETQEGIQTAQDPSTSAMQPGPTDEAGALPSSTTVTSAGEASSAAMGDVVAVASGVTGDSDVAMQEDSAGSGEEPTKKEAPEIKTPEPSPLKLQLDSERQGLVATVTSRGLELADHHDALVFDVKDSIIIYSDDSVKTSQKLKSVIEAVHSLATSDSVGTSETESKLALRLHLLALVLNEEAVFRELGPDLARMACNAIGALASGYDHSAARERHAKWLAPLFLVASAVLTRQEEPREVPTPIGENPGPAPIGSAKSANTLEAEAHAFLSLCMRCLATAQKLVHEDFLALYRLLVLLTRNAHMAKSLLQRDGIRTLMRPFSKQSSLAQGCQVYLVVVLRHIVEAQGSLRSSMLEEVRAWFAQSRTPNAEVGSVVRGLSQVALRDPDTFLDIMKDEAEISEFYSTKGNCLLHLVRDGEQSTAQSANADADETIEAPPSPTRAAKPIESDAAMVDLTTASRSQDMRQQQPEGLSEADGVIHLLLSELLATLRERSSLWANHKQAGTNASTSVSAQAGDRSDAPSAADVPASVATDLSDALTASAAELTDSSARSQEDEALNSTYFYMCFVMQCLTELTSSYTACKSSFVNCSKKRLANFSSGKETSGTPRSKGLPGIMTLFFSELVPMGFTERLDDAVEARRRATISNCAMSTVVGLSADVCFHQSIKEVASEVIGARKQLLEALSRALKDASTSSEVIEVRYGRLYALAELCQRLLTARPVTGGSTSASQQKEDLTLHVAKTMLEKNFVPVLTAALADVDLNLPTVKTLLDALLRPLDHLTRIATRTQSKSGHSKSTSATPSDSEMDSVSEGEPDLESDREDTPDFYRTSALGMHTGEMGDPDDSMDEDEDGMEEDEIGEMGYSDDEDRSDLSDESGDEDDEDMEDHIADVLDGDEMDDGGPSDSDDEIDELHDDEDGIAEGEDDEDGWTDEDSEGDEDSEEDDGLDFIIGESEDLPGNDEGAFEGMYGDEEGHGFEQLDFVDDEEAEEYGSQDESDYENELPLMHNGPPLQSYDRYGANWNWIQPGDNAPGDSGRGRNRGPLVLPPTFFSPPEVTGNEASTQATTSGRSSARRYTLQHAGMGFVGGTQDDDPASHPLLLDQQREGQPTQAANRRARRGGVPGPYQDWASSIQDLVGESAVSFFEAIFGRPGEAQAGAGATFGDGPEAPRIQVAGLGADGIPAFPGGGGHAARGHGRGTQQRRTRAVESGPTDPVEAVRAFNPAPTISRLHDEQRIVFGDLAADRVARLRDHITWLLLPSWQEKAHTRQSQREELQQITGERDRILSELNNMRARLEQHQNEVDGLRTMLNQRNQVQTRPQGTAASTDATAHSTLPSASEAATEPERTTEDVEMAETPASSASAARIELNSLQQGLQELDRNAASQAAADASGRSEEQPTSESVTGPPNADSEGAPRNLFLLNGREVDITDLGIDREVLAALPEEMQEEVVSQALRERRVSSLSDVETSISPEFLNALPAELRAEVLEQEAADRAERRHQQEQQESREANVRGDRGIQAANEGEAAGNSRNGQGAARQEGQPNPENDFRRQLASMVSSSSHQRFGGGSGRVATAAASKDKQPQRDSIQLLDGNGIAAMIRLLYFPGLASTKRSLHKVLANLARNAKTRGDILHALLKILSDGCTDSHAVEKSFANVSARAQSGTPGRTPALKRSTSTSTLGPQQAGASAALAPLSRTGEDAPHLVASRSIETLLYLTSVNTQSAVWFLQEDLRQPKKGKGKDRDRGSGAAVNTLLSLLDKPSILGNAQITSSLIALLNTVTKHITSVTAQAQAESAAKKEPQASEGEPAKDDESKAKDGDGQMDKEREPQQSSEKPLHVSKENLAAVVRPLGTAISSKGFQNTLAVAAHLAAIDAESREAVTTALRNEAMAATAVLSQDLDSLLSTLPAIVNQDDDEESQQQQQQQQQQSSSDDQGEATPTASVKPRAPPKDPAQSRIQSPALPVLASPASAQARLLRSLRAIEWLHGGR